MKTLEDTFIIKCFIIILSLFRSLCDFSLSHFHSVSHSPLSLPPFPLSHPLCLFPSLFLSHSPALSLPLSLYVSSFPLSPSLRLSFSLPFSPSLTPIIIILSPPSPFHSLYLMIRILMVVITNHYGTHIFSPNRVWYEFVGVHV